MQCICQKPSWQSKIQNPAILNKWKEEATSQISDKSIIDFAISELQYHSKNTKNGVTFTGVDGIFQADGLIEEDLKKEFLKEAKILEEAPFKDWHPGSNEQVLDLVHPSLYCFVDGVSRQVEDTSAIPFHGILATGEKKAYQPPKLAHLTSVSPYAISKKYQVSVKVGKMRSFNALSF